MSLEMLSAVWNLELKRNEKDVMEVLAWHANAEGICWPSKARIMYTKNLSESTVKRTLNSLKEKGLISVVAHAEGGRGKTPLYQLHPQKGVTKTPFEEWVKGVNGNHKGVQNDVKGFRAVTPEPTIEPSVEPSSSTRSAKADKKAPKKQKNRTPQQLLTDSLYDQLREKYNIRLTPDQYEFHLDKFRLIREKDEATDEECARVVTYMVESFPKAPKIDPLKAIQAVRLGRDTGEAWQGPAPWEEHQEKSYYEKKYGNEDAKEIARRETEELERKYIHGE